MSLPGTEFAIATYVAIVVILVAVGTWSRGAKTWSWRRLLVPAVFLVSSLALLLLAHSRVLRYDPTINPDEAEFAANAMLTRYGWLNWNIAELAHLRAAKLRDSCLALSFRRRHHALLNASHWTCLYLRDAGLYLPGTAASVG